MTEKVTIILKNGKVYDSSPETAGCMGCIFHNSDIGLCEEAFSISGYCHTNKSIWKEALPRSSHKSITQEIRDFNSTMMDELEKQLPGTKYDQDKLQYTLIPPKALAEVARNLTIGLKKYKERDNWKKVPNAEQRYLDALYRHLEAHRSGEIYDPDSSVPDMLHLAAVAVNAMFLLEFMLNQELKEK